MESPDPQTNDYNEDVPNEQWKLVAEVWVSLVPLKGREFTIAQQVNSTLTNKFVCRNMIGITDRILNDYRFFDPINNRAFNIIQHLTDFYTADTKIELLCVEDENPS